MRTFIHTAAFLALSSLPLSACTPETSSGTVASANLRVPPPNGFSCQIGEELLFAGEVEDDFGLSISVCRAGRGDPKAERLTVHYSGEGGGSTVSCLVMHCGKEIEFSHYVRPRFTLITLIWRDGNGEQRLIETFDAQDESTEPRHAVRHTWIAKNSGDVDLEALSYPVTASTEALSLLSIM